MTNNGSPGGVRISSEQGKKWSESLTKNIEREMIHFRSLLPQLLETDKGKFAAISDGKIIGKDADEHALAERVAQDYPGQFVLIQPIAETISDRDEIISR